jgi:hypothetical protein
MGHTKAQAVTNVKKKVAMANAQAIAAKVKAAAAKTKRGEKIEKVIRRNSSKEMCN